MNLDKYRKLSHDDLSETPIVIIYHNMIAGNIHALPTGTWQRDEDVIVLIRYVLEVKLGLLKDQIPKINRSDIKKCKLWGALNRFKSIRKLIHFVYPGVYHECDFSRVPVDYWKDIGRVKERFEWKLAQAGMKIVDIPSVINYDLLIKWGFANPLKRHGDSPFRLLNAIYPSKFKEIDFKKVPHHFYEDKTTLKKQFFDMLKKEQITFNEIPKKVNQERLIKYGFSSVLSSYSRSPFKLITSLFPDYFSIEDFAIKPNGYWKDLSNARRAIEQLLAAEGVSEKNIPQFLTKKRLQEANLSGLLDKFHGSPIEIVNVLYPGKFDILEFQRVPNKYWYSQKNRIYAMRAFCEKHGIQREQLPLLNRAYFRKYLPKFISIADRHYDSKFYQWIIESFPEHFFLPEEFQLLMGEDGQVCDSKEELVLHNVFIQWFSIERVKREAQRFFNNKKNEAYIPDWIIENNGQKFIIEYFGLYESNLYKGYTEKTKRKITFYQSLSEYIFVAIFPRDFKKVGFDRLLDKLNMSGLTE
ncbi:hypothetical protein [Bacillus sp. EB600]|uniref:hypothetical protein n=1 Tax=Bacillus sp. EB600 TaxID=2806345 RepID=UPI00210E0253|nr:hypothetical protein [Bacillus sp. EB600]MCQ6278698.1 hypothetical protein [Bacillus sp. EB600]